MNKFIANIAEKEIGGKTYYLDLVQEERFVQGGTIGLFRFEINRDDILTIKRFDSAIEAKIAFEELEKLLKGFGKST